MHADDIPADNQIQARIDRAVFRYAWDESKHHRGQPKNKGQFGPGGGGAPSTDTGKDAGKSDSSSGPVSGSGKSAETGKPSPSGDSIPGKAPPNPKAAAGPPFGEAKAVASAPPGVRQAVEQSGQLNAQKTAPPPGGYNPNPAEGKAARVGVPGMVVPPPPAKIPRLNNLTPEERQVENEFATMFESNPDGMADQMIQAMAQGMGDGPNIFATDEAKGLFGKWKGTKVVGPDGKADLSPETKEFRSKFNTSLHQTANAVTKRAFLRYLDNVVANLPEDKKHVLVTAGGVAAGKGFAVANVGSVNAVSQLAGATWDSAGEQNSTELPWLAQECEKRGIKMTAVFVHSNPTETWENPKRGVIERAGKKGRMVDARAFADSYTYGARNFHQFAQQHASNPNVQTVVLDNTRPPGADGKPDVQPLPQVPQEMLSMDPEALYGRCLQALESAPAPPAVKEGGSAGVRIWGPPQVAGSQGKSAV